MNEFLKKNKKSVLYATMIFLVYLAWICSFKNTLDALLLYRSLSKDQKEETVGVSTLNIVKKKHDFYKSVLKSYRISNSDKAGYQWQSISGIAMVCGLALGFEPEIPFEQDSSKLEKHISISRFKLYGSCTQVIKALDSISRTGGMGRPSSFLLKREMVSGEVKSGRMVLQLDISSLQ